ncbi:sporulation protein [Amycolatopsis sp. SID8362]|uniref:sporulation protein n=1 Tax=Amycolatopsis sp. SID8362 TaxID=2690346 RepID=UPI00137047E0|nr:sporulation protein [Amycolatopsis sp. SID8362]NBH07110.1 sporulation protein [Amycolatopsis sp. SID8362]NED43807.1 sporulation protein [Amycolatopsis sp. SID8362]
MFQKVLATFGSGGARIDARLLDTAAAPGRPLHGEVLLLGGEVDQEIKGLSVTLLARVQVPGEDKTEDLPFGTRQLAGRETIRAGQQIRVPFEVPLPWETPVTSVYGKPLAGMAVGVRAELDLAAAVSDPFDADAVAIEPLPAQKRVLDALSRIGFTFREAILEQGRVDGAAQQLPFFQEIRFAPSPRFASIFSQVAVTFLASADRTDVVLEVTKRVRVSKTGGFGGRGQDFLGKFTMKPDVNWEKQLEDWLDQLARPRGIFD